LKKAILVYNPFSGQRLLSSKLDNIIARFMSREILLQPYRVYNEKHFRMLPHILKSENYSSVIISGGDGTVNMVTNIMLSNDINIPVGIIPSGTCNDFARSIGLPVKIDKCVDIILSEKTLDIDVGLVNGEVYFLNTCAGGILVDVSYSTSGELKKNIGSLAYYLKALGEISNTKPFHLKLETENESIELEALMFLILNGRHVGGFNNVAWKADLTDGLMDIIIIKNCWHIDLAGILIKVLANELAKDKNIISLKAKKCTIEGNSDVALSLDGEKGPNLPITVEFINKKLSVFVK